MCSICSILIISLKSFGPLAGPRAYSHYLSPHNVHPSLIYCISAKLQPICEHTYTMQCTVCSILIISLQSLGPSAGPRAYPHHIRPHKVHPFIGLWHLCKDSAYLAAPASIYTLCSIRSILIISLQSLCSLAGLRAFPHYIRPHRSIHTLIYCISAKLQTIQLLCGHPNTI